MEKINITKLLKGCPKGMELDCTIFEDVHFDCIDDVSDIINCYIQDSKHKIGISFSKYGCYSNISKSKCVIFPKGKTTWEGFQRPFNDGDILSYQFAGFKNRSIYIYKYYPKLNTSYYVALSGNNLELIVSPKAGCALCGNDATVRFATEEEKQQLFDAIKANGYKWNAETKTLEKLTPNKFDINTLVPFESRVLIRDYNYEKWKASFWGYLTNNFYGFNYDTIRGNYKQCIPYEGNEHLLGTTDDCDEYFKTWK